MIKLLQGDAIVQLKSLASESVDAIITDPPYSSGGMTAAARKGDTGSKYCSAHLPSFVGDNKDQRAQAYWMHMWLTEMHRVAKDGAPICVFTDWRQLPLTSDAVQAAGFITRGILVWDKGNARPQQGRPRNQAEYIVWGSKGNMPTDRRAPIIPGVLRCTAPSASVRVHQTQKPDDLLEHLVQICEPGGTILDAFMGSGSTGVAAVRGGYSFIGIEYMDSIFATAKTRVRGATRRPQRRAA